MPSWRPMVTVLPTTTSGMIRKEMLGTFRAGRDGLLDLNGSFSTMAEILCLTCQHFTPREKLPIEVASRWKGICGHKDYEEANLVDTVHNCRVYLRIVYQTRFEKIIGGE